MHCPHRTTFVTLVSGRSYLHSALCLPHQLRLLGSRCPTAIVYDDGDAAGLNSLAVASLLSAAYSQRHPLSALRSRYLAWRETYGKLAKGSSCLGSTASATRNRSHHRAHQQRNRSSSGGGGGDSYGNSNAPWQPSLKLWVWAVPDVDAAVFLDTDLLLRPLDSLLSRAIELTTKQGVSGCSCKSRYGDRFFNTGVFLYRPSLETLESLLRLHRFAQVLSIPQPPTPSLRPPCALPAPSLRPFCALLGHLTRIDSHVARAFDSQSAATLTRAYSPSLPPHALSALSRRPGRSGYAPTDRRGGRSRVVCRRATSSLPLGRSRAGWTRARLPGC